MSVRKRERVCSEFFAIFTFYNFLKVPDVTIALSGEPIGHR